MDNSVYQPLSHALNPPPPDSRPAYTHPVHLHNTLQPPIDRPPDHDVRADTAARHEEEEEEEEEVEGAVSAPLHQEKSPYVPYGSLVSSSFDWALLQIKRTKSAFSTCPAEARKAKGF